jgi:hypothetical protein
MTDYDLMSLWFFVAAAGALMTVPLWLKLYDLIEWLRKEKTLRPIRRK